MSHADDLCLLPAPDQGGPLTVEQAIARRRSRRSFDRDAISLQALSQLLWALQGVTGEHGERSTPSAQQSHPLQILVAAGAVTALPVGLHRYEPGAHCLHRTGSVDLRPALRHAAFDDQPWIEECAAVLVVTADVAALDHQFRHQPPVGVRGRRYADIETGAAAQNAHLQAESLDLAFVLVAGFDDARTRSALLLETGVEPTALLLIGRKE